MTARGAQDRGGFAAAIAALVPELAAALGEELLAVALFGSVVRGEARAHSDLDVLVVARSWPRGMSGRLAALERAHERVEALLRAARPEGILSLVPRTLEEVRRGGPLYLDMTVPGEVEVLLDVGGGLTAALEGLRRRLEALGARRVTTAGHRHWILKPDHRLGEVFEL